DFHSTPETGAVELAGYIRPGTVYVEVTRHDHVRPFGAVSDHLVDLREAQIIAAATLEVRIIGRDLDASNLQVRRKRDASSQPLLERNGVRNKPAGIPEAGLLAKTDHSRVPKRPR